MAATVCLRNVCVCVGCVWQAHARQGKAKQQIVSRKQKIESNRNKTKRNPLNAPCKQNGHVTRRRATYPLSPLCFALSPTKICVLLAPDKLPREVILPGSRCSCRGEEESRGAFIKFRESRVVPEEAPWGVEMEAKE